MPPMLGIDDGALADDSDIGAEYRKVCLLPGRPYGNEAQADDERDENKHRIADARDPAPRHEGVQIAIVRVLRKDRSKLQRTDSERQVERKRKTEQVAAEAAEMPAVVTLL